MSISPLPLRGPLPSLNLLRAFEAVARLGSVSAAASELCVTQSAVSHQVKALESWLGRKLVLRSGRGLELTEYGRLYVPKLSTAMELISNATDQVRSIGRRRTLTIQTTATFATQWLIPKLPQYYSMHQSCDVLISTQAASMHVESSQFDITLRCMDQGDIESLLQEPRWKGGEISAFLPDALAPIGAFSIIIPQSIKLTSWMKKQVLLQSRSTPNAWHDWFVKAQDPIRNDHRKLVFDHVYQSIQGAIAGAGIALAAPIFCDSLINQQLLQSLSPLTIKERNYCWLLPPRSVEDPVVRAFCAWLVASGDQSLSTPM
jgi:LysR family transcriptional regulator, glycine cleavage system transcriptional activator